MWISRKFTIIIRVVMTLLGLINIIAEELNLFLAGEH